MLNWDPFEKSGGETMVGFNPQTMQVALAFPSGLSSSPEPKVIRIDVHGPLTQWKAARVKAYDGRCQVVEVYDDWNVTWT